MARSSCITLDPAWVQRPWTLTSPLTPPQVMLQGRLYALYQRSRIILALMIFGYVCEVAAISTIMGFVDNLQSTSVHFPSRV
ncbi:hypothetical protein J3R83DRAFT_11657 [Lanmaoa asiatica]|nr:hypothetical protein J3R83DRAFT_11657 [Lanmaoa asiatica]